MENPYIEPPDVTTENYFLYFNEDNVGGPRTDPRGGNILRERIDLELEVFFNAAAEMAAIKN